MTLAQLAFSALAAVGLLVFAMILAVVGLARLVEHGFDTPEATPTLLLAYSLGMMGLLCLPSVWTALLRLLKTPGPLPAIRTWLQSRINLPWQRLDAFGLVTLLVLVIFPPTLLLGHLVAQDDRLAWLVLPPLNLLATGLPVLWLALLGIRKLHGGSAQRLWGVFACALTYSPLLILVAELVLILLGGMVALAWLSTQPDLLNEFLGVLEQIRSMPTPDPQAIQSLLLPYLDNPQVILGLVLMAAVLVPLIEELLKPLAVWLLAWKKLSPAQGWVAGLLSGAGFALFENLGNTSGGGDQWALVTASRVTAALLHMLTSGLVGWALAAAWRERRWGRLVLVYAAAVSIHGLWNGLAVLGSVNLPIDLPTGLPADLPINGLAAVGGLVLLGIFIIVMYLSMNHTLRQAAPAQASDLSLS